jgi:hypothetical protein
MGLLIRPKVEQRSLFEAQGSESVARTPSDTEVFIQTECTHFLRMMRSDGENESDGCLRVLGKHDVANLG